MSSCGVIRSVALCHLVYPLNAALMLPWFANRRSTQSPSWQLKPVIAASTISLCVVLSAASSSAMRSRAASSAIATPSLPSLQSPSMTLVSLHSGFYFRRVYLPVAIIMNNKAGVVARAAISFSIVRQAHATSLCGTAFFARLCSPTDQVSKSAVRATTFKLTAHGIYLFVKTVTVRAT